MARVTLVGGAGDVGSLILPLLSEHHEVRIADLRAPADFDGDYVPVDVSDAASLLTACADTDVLVYLAMGPKHGWGGAEWARRQFDVNVTGLYDTLRAAAAQGVGRFVHASTGSIFADYEADELPPFGDATDAYGLSKAAAEMVCRAATREYGMAGISLRLIGPVSDEEWLAAVGTEHADVITAGSDIARAFASAVASSLEGYHTLMVSGDHTGTRIDCSETDRLLDWRPLARRPRVLSKEIS